MPEGAGDKKRARADFAVGQCGVFYTTTAPSGAARAKTDLLRLLEDSLKKQDAPMKSLDAELAELKDGEKDFVAVRQVLAKGTGFLKFMRTDVKPSEIVARVLETQKLEFQAKNVAPSS